MISPYAISRPDENGYCYVSRRSDNVVIGCVWPEDDTWSGRYYYGGGGATFLWFKGRKEAADFVYERSALSSR